MIRHTIPPSSALRGPDRSLVPRQAAAARAGGSNKRDFVKLLSAPKRLVRPGLGFGGFHTARRTLAGYEAMAMIRKGQVRKIGGRDMQGQTIFIAKLFEIAA